MFDPTPPEHLALKQRKIGRFIVFSNKLGSGTFAIVHLAVDTVEQKQVACKSIKLKRERDYTTVLKEVRMLRELNHPNINKVVGEESDRSFMYIFVQLCPFGDLFTYLTTRPAKFLGRLCEGEAQYIMYQLLVGIRYLHDRKIAHRDLKPENILLDVPGPYPHIQIADFGLARYKSYEETLNVCGTVSYLPPEGIVALDRREMGYVGMPSDCWAAGCILYIMLAGYHPFDRKDTCEHDFLFEMIHEDLDEEITDSSCGSDESVESDVTVKRRIVNGRVPFASDPWDKLPTALQLVECLLIPDPMQRATVYRALDSEWIKEDIQDLEQHHYRQSCSTQERRIIHTATAV